MKRFFQPRQIVGFVRENPLVVIVCVVFLFVGLFSLNRVLIYTPDSARYLAWSQSLAHLEGFRDGTTPEPTKYVVHAPLYSVLLAPTAWISSSNAILGKLLTTFLGIALIGIVYWWGRDRLGKVWAAAFCAILAMHPAMVLYSTQVLSDVPFAICVFLFFYLIERESTAKSAGGSTLLVLTAVIVSGLFLREVGLTLVISCTVILLFKKNYRAAILIGAVSVGFYTLWYIRNEVFIASIEHPPMRNSQLFFSHLFTPENASILQEFGTRMTSNAAVYGTDVARLSFAAEPVLRNISTMAPGQFPISVALAVMPYVFGPILAFTVLAICIGGIVEFRHRSRSLVLVIFTIVYLVPILLYPISDVRFLFPLLIIMLYLFCAGIKFFTEWLILLLGHQKLFHFTTAFVILFLALPNIAWTITYVSNNWRYNRSPLEFYESVRTTPSFPEVFSRPIDLAGNWVASHSNPTETIISRWKELGFYTQGRKVLDVDPQILLDLFENILRDYNVHYIVTVVSRGGLREYEQLFAQSSKFEFQTVCRIANVEVVEVERTREHSLSATPDDDSTEAGVQERFQRAIVALENSKPSECERMLNSLPLQVRKQAPVIMNFGVAKEFSGDLDQAKNIFGQFRSHQQAGSFVLQSWYHLEIISKLKSLSTAQTGSERAQKLHFVAAYYWALGFRNQSLLTLDRSIAADSTFFPAIVFRAIYSLQNGDTSKSEFFLKKSRLLDPSNSLVVSLSTILQNIHILSRPHDIRTDVTLRLANVHQLEAMGMLENAIDELLLILRKNPSDQTCLRELVAVYEQKGRYAPALEYLRMLANSDPGNLALKQEIQQLLERW